MTPNFLQSELPLAAAPMAGGATGIALTEAALRAGGLAFSAAGYKTPQALGDEIAAIRGAGLGGHGYGVNLFVPAPPEESVDQRAFARYAAQLQPEAEAYGLRLDPHPKRDDDAWAAKLDLLCADPVPLVSLTFGLPARADISRLQRAGSAVLATVTTPAEAAAAEEVGVDALVVQGPRAGGHSASWDPHRVIVDARTEDVVESVRARTRLPLLAAGGVDGAASVARLRASGADVVVLGTLLLLAEEAGTSATHRRAIAGGADAETVITRVFTGRPARALRNGFVDRHHAHEITGYPAVHHLTRELRQRAAAAGDSDRLHLWAGTGFRAARAEPVASVLRRLAEFSEATPR